MPLNTAHPHQLIEELISRTDQDILESFGPCDGSFAVLELVQKLRTLLSTND